MSLHKQGQKDTKRQTKALNVPRDTVGSIVRKFEVKGTLATLPERGRKRKLSTAITRVLRRQVVKNPWLTAKHLQQDLVAAVPEVSVSTVRRILYVEGLNALTPLLTQKHEKSQLQFAKNYINEPKKALGICSVVQWNKLEFFGLMDQHYVYRRKNEAYVEKNILHMHIVKHGGGSVMLCGCFASSGTGNLRHVESKMDSIKRTCHAICEEAEAWMSLDFPTRQWFQAYLKVQLRLGFRRSPGRY